MALGDGGNFENTGLLPLLQRGLKKCICFINSYSPLDLNFKPDHFIEELSPSSGESSKRVNVDDHDDQYQCAAAELLSLFGAVEEIKLEYNYTNNQVFAKDDLNKLMLDFLDNVKKGKGAVSKQTFRVLENKVWNIQGGYDVEILFVYNERVHNFEKRLPLDTRTEIKDPEGHFEHYPFYSTTYQNSEAFSLEEDEVTLLVAQAEFIVKENDELFLSIFQ